MDAAEIQRLLKEGIAAIRQGDRARGRELLLRVVEADERVEPAWLWLSVAVDDPHDKLVALENALAINPHNAPAQTQLQTLQKQLGLAQPPPPPPPPPSPPPPPPLPPYADPDDDPYQCAYCGRPTQAADAACPHCGRSLLAPGAWQGKGFQNSLVILTGFNLQFGILQILGAVLAAGLAQGYDLSLVTRLSQFEIVTAFFGDFGGWAKTGVAIPFGAAFARDFLLIILFLMLYTDMDAAYPAALGVALLDAAWAVVGPRVNYLGFVAATINLILALFTLAVAALALWSRRRVRVRLLVRLDKDAHGGLGMYQAGQTYRRRGQWTLAAIHFQKALALKPSEARFYKDAGVALARLGRYPKALRVLEEGARRAPEDPDFRKLIETIQAGK